MAVLRGWMAVMVCVGMAALGQGVGQTGPAAGVNPPLPSIFLVGNGGPGLAAPLGRLFDHTKINIVDRSVAGAGARSVVEGGSWAATLATVRSGDFVLIQFARQAGSAGEAESLPGVSDDARRAATPGGDGAVRTYGWYLRRVAVEVIARGATPILCAPVEDDATEQGRDEAWTKAIAVQQRLAFVDVPAAVGSAPSPTVGVAADAGRTAMGVVAGLRGLREDPLSGYFSAEGNKVPAYRLPPPAGAATKAQP